MPIGIWHQVRRDSFEMDECYLDHDMRYLQVATSPERRSPVTVQRSKSGIYDVAGAGNKTYDLTTIVVESNSKVPSKQHIDMPIEDTSTTPSSTASCSFQGDFGSVMNVHVQRKCSSTVQPSEDGMDDVAGTTDKKYDLRNQVVGSNSKSLSAQHVSPSNKGNPVANFQVADKANAQKNKMQTANKIEVNDNISCCFVLCDSRKMNIRLILIGLLCLASYFLVDYMHFPSADIPIILALLILLLLLCVTCMSTRTIVHKK